MYPDSLTQPSVACFLLWLGMASATAGTVSLTWDANSEPELAGYIVSYGPAPNQYSNSLDVGNVTSATVTGPELDVPTYWVVAAYNTAGVESSPSDEVCFSDSSQSSPPKVWAGHSQTTPIGATVFLEGSAMDDGPPGSLTSTWIAASGPGPVTFENASSLRTMASIPIPGSYVMRLTATDGSNSASDDVVVIVHESPNALATLSLEAEFSTLSGGMRVELDSVASHGQFVMTSVPDHDVASFRFHVPIASTYAVWCRVIPSPMRQDAFYVSVDGGPEEIFDVALNTWSTQWEWEQLHHRKSGTLESTSQSYLLLPEGHHENAFRGSSADLGLDRIMITNNPRFFPPDPPVIAFAGVPRSPEDSENPPPLEEPSPSVTVYIPLAVGDAVLEAPMIFEEYRDKSWVASHIPMQGSAHFQVFAPEPGEYIIWARVLSMSKDCDSFMVSVNGGTIDQFECEYGNWRRPPAWHWMRVNGSGGVRPMLENPRRFTLSQGWNTVTFAGACAHTRLSRLVVTNDPNFTASDWVSVIENDSSFTLSETVLRKTLRPGFSLLANQLSRGSNSLAEVLPIAPEGSILWKYDSESSAYSLVFFSDGLWSDPSCTLAPGEGAFLHIPEGADFTLELIGTVVHSPEPIALRAGANNLLSLQGPARGLLSQLLSFPFAPGDIVRRYNRSTGGYAEYTFGYGGWDREPTIGVAEAFFLQLAPR